VFVFERRIDGRKYVRAFRVATEDEAIAAAVAFRKNPLASPAGGEDDPPRVNVERIEAFGEHQSGRKLDPNYIADTRRSLYWFCEMLKGRDLREVKLADLSRLLRDDSNRRAKIVAIKAFTKWLRSDLRAELDLVQDPTLGLRVPKGTPEHAIRVKAHTIETIEKLYTELRGWSYHAGQSLRLTNAQPARDTIRIAATTGLHLTEIDRLARGLGRIDLIEHPEIAAVFRVWHKNDRPHSQSVPRSTLEAMQRLIAKGRAPGKHEMSKYLKKACKVAEVPLVRMGDFRHTFNTWGRSVGQAIEFQPGQGISRQRMSEILGHDQKTNKAHYDESIPVMAKIPIVLSNSSDPTPGGGGTSRQSSSASGDTRKDPTPDQRSAS
jgi:integrase